MPRSWMHHMTKPTLYEILGVAPDASDAEIKAAYRRRAKETHPDQNDGSADAFNDVGRAYRALSDHTRRAQYDRTGKVDESDPAAQMEVQAQAQLTLFVRNAIREAGARGPERFDLMAFVKHQQDEAIRQLKAQAAEAREDAEDQAAILERMKWPPGDPTPLQRALEDDLRNARAKAEALDGAVEVILRTVELAKAFSYQFDAQQDAELNRMIMTGLGQGIGQRTAKNTFYWPG